MAQFKAIPIKNPHTYPTHMGPGAERGQPYWPLGCQFHQQDLVVGQNKKLGELVEMGRSKSGECHLQRRLNLAENVKPISGITYDYMQDHDQRCKINNHSQEPCTMYTYSQPDSHRSCVVSYNKDGLTMNSLSHYNKISAKHLQNQSRSSPIHIYFDEKARKVPDLDNQVWDCGIVNKYKATSADIGNWTPVWYQAVNDMNVYSKYNDKTLKALGLKRSPADHEYGREYGDKGPIITSARNTISARTGSSGFTPNPPYSGRHECVRTNSPHIIRDDVWKNSKHDYRPVEQKHVYYPGAPAGKHFDNKYGVEELKQSWADLKKSKAAHTMSQTIDIGKSYPIKQHNMGNSSSGRASLSGRHHHVSSSPMIVQSGRSSRRSSSTTASASTASTERNHEMISRKETNRYHQIGGRK